MRPEDAVDAARAEVARLRAAGAYGEDQAALQVPPPERPTTEALYEWAVLEPDIELVTSTRRLGAPIRWLKRAMVHLLRQYNGQLTSQQTRMNLHLMARTTELDERLADLQQRLEDLERT